jgi:hypothetical protein
MKVYVLATSIALAACSSVTSTPSASQSQSEQSAAVALRTNPACQGSGGVIALPCPVKLTKHNGAKGVVVTVSGPGVVNSEIVQNECGGACRIAPVGSGDVTQWLVTSAPDCGNGYIHFTAYNASGGYVGGAYLLIKNRYCPPT